MWRTGGTHAKAHLMERKRIARLHQKRRLSGVF